ncbi:hypothetical protein DFH09DRAFT_1081380 [Mycena vulgaris]|nr:hypothetical protein DFH09DRAFT_1081380 [Mycena vulgaris]
MAEIQFLPSLAHSTEARDSDGSQFTPDQQQPRISGTDRRRGRTGSGNPLRLGPNSIGYFTLPANIRNQGWCFRIRALTHSEVLPKLYLTQTAAVHPARWSASISTRTTQASDSTAVPTDRGAAGINLVIAAKSDMAMGRRMTTAKQLKVHERNIKKMHVDNLFLIHGGSGETYAGGDTKIIGTDLMNVRLRAGARGRSDHDHGPCFGKVLRYTNSVAIRNWSTRISNAGTADNLETVHGIPENDFSAGIARDRVYCLPRFYTGSIGIVA